MSPKTQIMQRLHKLCRRLAEENVWQLASEASGNTMVFVVRQGNINVYQSPEGIFPLSAHSAVYEIDEGQELTLEVIFMQHAPLAVANPLAALIGRTLRHSWAQDQVRQQFSVEMLRQYRESALILKAAQAFIGKLEHKEIADGLVSYFSNISGAALLDTSGKVVAGGGIFAHAAHLDIPLPEQPQILSSREEEERTGVTPMWHASLCYPLHADDALYLFLVSTEKTFVFDTIYLQRVATLATIASTAFNNAELWRSRVTLSRYLPKGIADKLLRENADNLGGIEQEATILFADIRDFTPLTRQLGAHETVRILNLYFTEIVRIVRGNDGIIDKFMGDGVLAVFGVPYNSGQDADNALISAQRIVERCRTLGDEIGMPLKIGICMATGMVVSGNIGAPERMDYTVIGEAVNQAAKMQRISKQYDAPVIVLESTQQALKDAEHIAACVALVGEEMNGLKVFRVE